MSMVQMRTTLPDLLDLIGQAVKKSYGFDDTQQWHPEDLITHIQAVCEPLLLGIMHAKHMTTIDYKYRTPLQDGE